MRLKHLRLITYLSGTQIVEGKTYRAWYNRGEILVFIIRISHSANWIKFKKSG